MAAAAPLQRLGSDVDGGEAEKAPSADMRYDITFDNHVHECGVLASRIRAFDAAPIVVRLLKNPAAVDDALRSRLLADDALVWKTFALDPSSWTERAPPPATAQIAVDAHSGAGAASAAALTPEDVAAVAAADAAAVAPRPVPPAAPRVLKAILRYRVMSGVVSRASYGLPPF